MKKLTLQTGDRTYIEFSPHLSALMVRLVLTREPMDLQNYDFVSPEQVRQLRDWLTAYLSPGEPAVPDEPVKSEAFMCGYERAQGRWEMSDEQSQDTRAEPWFANPFEVGTDEQKGFSQAVYDLTK